VKYFYLFVVVAILILSLISLLMKKVWPSKSRGEYLVEIMKEKDNELYEIMKTVSQETESSLEAVVFIHYSLIKNTETVNNEDDACENFVILVNDIYSNAKKGLLSLQLRSSEDLDKIAAKLSEKQIIQLPENFSFKGLDQIFEKDT